MNEAISQDRERCQFPFCLMKNPLLYGAAAGRAVGRRAKSPLSSCSLELRASSTVGLRWQAVFGSSDRLDSIDSTRRGTGWQAEMAEDLDDHRRIFDACPEQPVEGAAMIFKAPPQLGQSELCIERPSR